jgi:hypothetical protein
MGMPQYDPTVIHTHAKRLYETANLIVIAYAGLGLLVGLSVGYGYATMVRSPDSGMAAGIVGLVFAAIGFLLGQTRAFALRLAAQLALCQLQIEANTRHAAHTTHATGVVASRGSH